MQRPDVPSTCITSLLSIRITILLLFTSTRFHDWSTLRATSRRVRVLDIFIVLQKPLATLRKEMTPIAGIHDKPRFLRRQGNRWITRPIIRFVRCRGLWSPVISGLSWSLLIVRFSRTRIFGKITSSTLLFSRPRHKDVLRFNLFHRWFCNNLTRDL